MVGAARHPDQVSRLHFDGKHRTVGRMDVEHAPTFDDEADFVLVVPVLGLEFLQHYIEVGRIGEDVDDVGGHIAATSAEFGDL